MKTKVAGVLFGLFLLAGCSQGAYGTSHGIKDAPVNRDQDNTPAKIVNFPDGYENVAFKCQAAFVAGQHGVGIYTTTREAAPVVVPNDPACP